MAKRATKSAAATVPAARAGNVADQVAEYIGTSLADLMNRKDALARQLATVDQQIAAVRKRVKDAAQKLPALPIPGRRAASAPAKPAKAKAGNRKKKRPLPPDDLMVAATTRASAAEAKGRAAKQARTTRRSGNR